MPNGFKLAMDGMILNSVGELIVDDPDTGQIRRGCCASYQRCLEDFAFAVVYGSKIITGKRFRPSLSQPNQPGQDLVAQLGEICEFHELDSDLKDGALIGDPISREHIAADIRCLGWCVTDGRFLRYFKDYLVRESQKHLGTHSSLFQDGLPPEEYKFNVAVPYYRNRTLQDTLPAEAVSTLTGFLPRSPREGQDLFAPSALREFVTQNVLSLITIMWEYDESALRKGMWRMPHVVRSVVKQQSIHKALEQHQELLRDIVVRHALVTAARQGLNTKRDRLITMLTDLRDVSPFRDVREVLEHEDLVLLEPSHIKEKRAQALLRLIGGYCGSGDRDRFLLVRRSALRSLDSADASSYENEIHRIFPELQPTDWRRG